mmetsp:Transcript_11388/g.19350  ORF Transcript_11388/g.19350 Transcript_11388/m.19350 type:complete len:442 (-) Transcript_11388:135-1460(-)
MTSPATSCWRGSIHSMSLNSLPQLFDPEKASDDDNSYGFFCDEYDNVNTFTAILDNPFRGDGCLNAPKSSYGQPTSVRGATTSAHSVLSLNAYLERCHVRRPDAIAASRTTPCSTGNGSSTSSTFASTAPPTFTFSPVCSEKSPANSSGDGCDGGERVESGDLSKGRCKEKSAPTRGVIASFSSSCDNAGDLLAEAPVWIVAQGSGAHCAGCRCRHVFTARHTQSGRVFSRSFPVLGPPPRSNLSSTSAATLPSLDPSVSKDRKGAFRVLSSPSTWSSNARVYNTAEFDRPTAAALGGFRVMSGCFGRQWAEFELVVSSGADVYRAWRTHADVGILLDLVGVVRRRGVMPNTNLAWAMLQRQRRWFNATETLYLIDKRHILDLLFENLLYELDSPTQLLNFVDDGTWNGSVGPNSNSSAGDEGGRRGCACMEEGGVRRGKK